MTAALLAIPLEGPVPVEALDPPRSPPSATCDGIATHADELYRIVTRRPVDGGRLDYWVGLGRVVVARRDPHRSALRARSHHPEPLDPTLPWPIGPSPVCAIAEELGLEEVRPGIVAARTGATVTVLAEPSMVELGAVDGRPTRAELVLGDIVVNGNWFTPAGSQGPVVAGGELSGSPDTVERGQIVAYRPGCGPTGHEDLLDHVWTGEIYEHDECAVTAVSGVSLVHKGVRADAYRGYDLTRGYTNASPSHSFLGFSEDAIVVIASRELNASELADYALSLGVVEGIMLDGGGSTQIKTPDGGLWSNRRVPSFAVLDSVFEPASRS